MHGFERIVFRSCEKNVAEKDCIILKQILSSKMVNTSIGRKK